MRTLTIVVALLVGTGVSSAQTLNPPRPGERPNASRVLRDAGNRQDNLTRNGFNLTPRPVVDEAPATLCLDEKRTGRAVCHTEAEWRAIAARLANGEDWK